jgi:hypothetical protein
MVFQMMSGPHERVGNTVSTIAARREWLAPYRCDLVFGGVVAIMVDLIDSGFRNLLTWLVCHVISPVHEMLRRISA